MANPEHVEIVKQGAAAVSAWREVNSGAVLDLSRAEFSKLDLSGIDFSFANLELADFRSTNLSRASFRGCNLMRAVFFEADLRGADLSCSRGYEVNFVDTRMGNAILFEMMLRRATLLRTDLSCAVLMKAALFEAKLYDAKLDRTSFNRAHFAQTIIANSDLSAAIGLDDVLHFGASTIGFDTLVRSKGKIPESFLRGCGVPQTLIDYLPSLIGSMEPIEFYSCFISHSSKDEDFARRLYARLVADKLQVWFAPEDMRGGRKSAEQIDQAIRVYDRLLLVLSEASLNSEWVRREIKRARKKEKETGKNVLFPIGLVPFGTIRSWECLDSDSGEDLAATVREYHIPDFSDWKHEDAFETAFADLMRDLRCEADQDEATKCDS